MDENLVESTPLAPPLARSLTLAPAVSYKNPLYVREASKRFMKAAVFNDTLFLSNQNVMDYSLVVGVDSVKQELVVGIVGLSRSLTYRLLSR